MVAASNADVRRVLFRAGSVTSPDWNGQRGRKQDVFTRREGQGASKARQQRAADWRAEGGNKRGKNG